MNIFGFATITPVILLLVAAGVGGIWGWLAVLYITLFTFFMDRLARERPSEDPGAGSEFPAGRRLAVFLGVAHFVLLAAAIWAIAGPSGHGLAERVVALAGFGLFFGQVSHPNAHELIHSGNRRLYALGRVIYATLLFGHHVSAHRLVHHVHVATDDDPSSAPIGESFWAFLPRAWVHGFYEGYLAENVLLARAGRSQRSLRHPYVGHILGAVGTMALAAVIGGLPGVVALLVLAAYAQFQILLSDYVQHYGLRRAQLPGGKMAPVGPEHAWNAPHWYSSAMMLNAPRHSDHHINPARPYHSLKLDPETMPVLPHSMPVMAVLALWPERWHMVMDPLAAEWHPSNSAPDPFERLASARAAMNPKDARKRPAEGDAKPAKPAAPATPQTAAE
jgi:alkane 1-monooxygenase